VWRSRAHQGHFGTEAIARSPLVPGSPHVCFLREFQWREHLGTPVTEAQCFQPQIFLGPLFCTRRLPALVYSPGGGGLSGPRLIRASTKEALMEGESGLGSVTSPCWRQDYCPAAAFLLVAAA
jgi:hypothetical protein